jgi:membrane protein DedA with SNARE-associated domain
MRHTWELVLTWFSQHESLLIFLAILLEESGIPMPIPADVAMALAGFRVAQGEMSLFEAFAIGQSATLIGTSILYWVGRRGGRAILFRYARLLHLSPHRINQVERLVTRLGPLAVIIGRQVPGLRMATPLACGIFRVPYKQFLPAMFVGSSVYIGAFIALGVWGGPAALEAFSERGLPLRLLASSVMLLLAGILLRMLTRRAREVVSPVHRLAATKRRSFEAAIIAGIGASAVTTLSLTWLLEVIGLIAQTPPERALLQFLEADPTPGLLRRLARFAPESLFLTGLMATVPFQVLTHLAWAVVYAYVAEPRLRGRAVTKGLQFAALPWLFSGVVVFPLLDAGWFGTDFGGTLPMLGELLRNALFSVVLATLYRLVRLARQPRLHQGHRHGHRHQLPAEAGSAPIGKSAGPAVQRDDAASGVSSGEVSPPPAFPVPAAPADSPSSPSR